MVLQERSFIFFVSIYNCYRLVIIVGRHSFLVNFNLYCIIVSCVTNANDNVYHIKRKIQVNLCQTILHHLRYQRYQLKIKMSSEMVDYSLTGICCATSRSLHSNLFSLTRYGVTKYEEFLKQKILTLGVQRSKGSFIKPSINFLSLLYLSFIW